MADKAELLAKRIRRLKRLQSRTRAAESSFNGDDLKKLLFWPCVALFLILVILFAESCERRRKDIPVAAVEMQMPQEIRVIIMNDSHDSLYQKRVTLKSDHELEISAGDETMVLEAGKSMEFNSDTELFRKGVITVKARKKGRKDKDAGESASRNIDSLISVTDLKRDNGTPAYPGYFELEKVDGGIVLVNVVDFEEYIARVVPSEMPPKYEEEALKVQAVCARTYAVMQIAQKSYTGYDADVDDSINFQVYNNMGTDQRTRKAAAETAGQIITYQGEPAEALYFSTSCGYTTDGTIWGSSVEQVPHLRARTIGDMAEASEMEDNDNFYSFIRKNDKAGYESEYPFYRWYTEVPESRLKVPSSVGRLQGIFVTDRGEGGIVKKLTLVGSDGQVSYKSQSQIKSFLGRAAGVYHMNNGSENRIDGSLPSSFFTIDQTGTASDGTRLFTVWGGGYGHGVGMSQNGANAMAKRGMNYKEILRAFYTDVDISKAVISE